MQMPNTLMIEICQIRCNKSIRVVSTTSYSLQQLINDGIRKWHNI